MKRRVGVCVLVALLLMPLWASASVLQVVEFQKTPGIRVEVLSEEAFQARFGNNPDIPVTDESIIALAQKLYPPAWERRLTGADNPGEVSEEDQECREYEVGVLFAALQNPLVSSATREAVDHILAQAKPPLPKTYTSGHFKFYYTTNDANADHNVTLDEIKSTAAYLNSYWNKYVANFKTPKHYVSGGKQMVDVNVYYLGAGLLGETGSSWNYMNLNSKLCVKNLCKRRTTSAHELFHRVQYAYGYISGTANLKWIVEGTASWSQKYTNAALRDYMARMNQGLGNTNLNLITQRSYDAAHFWVRLEESATTNWAAVRDVWKTFQSNGKDAKAAVNTVVKTAIGASYTFDKFVQLWNKSNYIKDTSNAGVYEYVEDETTKTSCGVVYGPLSHVARTTVNVKADTNWGASVTLQPYGAVYYDFTLDPELTNLQIKMDGDNSGNFSYHFAGLKGGQWKVIQNTTSVDYTYKKTLTPGQWEKVALIIQGMSKGGSCSIGIGGDLTGTWSATESYTCCGDYTASWAITQTGGALQFLATRTSTGDTANGTGTLSGSNVTLDHPCYGSSCGDCTYHFSGTVDAGYAQMGGDALYACGDGYQATGTWTATKDAAGGTVLRTYFDSAGSINPR